MLPVVGGLQLLAIINEISYEFTLAVYNRLKNNSWENGSMLHITDEADDGRVSKDHTGFKRTDKHLML